jgi:TrmH family RNA methyltransferase
VYPDVPWRLIRSLSRKKERDRTGLTVAEGPSVVLAAVEAGVELQALVFAEESADSEKAHTVRQAMDEHDCSCQVFVVPGRLYHKMSGTRTPQGVLGLLRFPFRFARGRPDNTWAQDLDIVGVDIQDPGNVGTLVRTGACAGATSVILCGQSADPFSPKAIRASAGAIFSTGVLYEEDCIALLRQIHDSGKLMYKATPRDGMMPWEADFRSPCAVILGNEARGLSQEILEGPGECVTIPMPGGIESLNAAMACTALLYEAVRQRTGSNV